MYIVQVKYKNGIKQFYVGGRGASWRLGPREQAIGFRDGDGARKQAERIRTEGQLSHVAVIETDKARLRKTAADVLEQLRADPRVEEIEDERMYGNGWWCYLAKGWAMGGTGEAHCFSEETLPQLRSTLRHAVKRCECEDCTDPNKEKLWS
jgi:hypothetical protein